MTVYIELVFLENFIIDYFLLLATEKITYIPCKHPVWASLSGGIYALFMPLIGENLLLTLSVLFLMCFICFMPKKPKPLFYTVFAMLAISSVVFGILNLFFYKSKTGFFYEENVFFVIALLSTLFSVGMYRLLIPFMRKKKLSEGLVTLNLSGKEICAFIDSGNSLYYKDLPVILVNKQKLYDYSLPVKPLIIPYSTVNACGVLMGFKPENAFITYMGKSLKLNCVVALCDHKFQKDFDALLHPDLLEECV